MGYCHSRATKNSRSAMYATDKASELSWVAALAAGAAAQLVLAVMIARGPLPGLNVDDALHALAGAATWHDVVRLDLHSLYLDVYDQARWPPVGGFLLWPALAVFGPAEATYRLGILMWLVACVAAWTVAARAATENFRSAAWAGLILVLLALSSQFLLVASASVLCEIPGLAFMLGAYGAAHAAWERRCPRWFWLGGLLLAASWFTKWQYGIVATAALLLLLAHRRRLSGKTCGEIWLFLPSVVLVALWLASPYHLREMLMYLLWKPASAEKLRSYGAEFLRAVADAPLITKANLVATVVGLGLATRLSRRPVALALFAHLVIAALGSGLKDLSPRTGLWIAVPAWVLAAAGWGRLLGVKVSPRAGRPVLAMLGVLAIAVATHTALKVSREFRFWGASATDWHRPAARFIAAEVPPGARLLTVGAWSEFISPYHIKLEVLSQNWHRRFAARDLKIAEYPSLEWEPWRVWRLSLQALLRLRRPDMRPPRPQTAPEYVAVVSVIGDSYVLRATADLQARLVLEPWREKMLPGGTSVTIYRCLGWSNRRSVGPNTAP